MPPALGEVFEVTYPDGSREIVQIEYVAPLYGLRDREGVPSTALLKRWRHASAEQTRRYWLSRSRHSQP